ncbi:hypothetical protein HDZ31DRAFT_472, partial [Schizophyllum fasciatum]
ASNHAGAMIAPEFTSPTYDLPKLEGFWTLYYYFFGQDRRQTRERLLPDCVLSKSCLAPNSGWRFPGSAGHVGIRLRRPVVPSAISLYQPTRNLPYEGETAMARQIQVWSLVNDTSIQHLEGAVTRNISHFYHRKSDYHGHRAWSPSHPALFLLLGTWENPVRHEPGY